MLIFSVDSHAAATSRITETLIGAAAGLAAGLLFAPLRVQPAKDAVGDLSRQMADLLGEMADGLAAEAPDPKRATEWLERTRALRGEIERVDEALEPGRGERPAEPPAAQVHRPGGRACGTASTRWSERLRYAGAGAFGLGQRADRQRAQPGQGSRHPGPAGRRAGRAVRRGPRLRPAPRGRAGIRRDAGHAGLAGRAGLAGLAGRGLAGLAGPGGFRGSRRLR